MANGCAAGLFYYPDLMCWGVRLPRHDQSCPAFDPNLRRPMHIAYKIAAEMGPYFLDAVDRCERTIAPMVTESIYQRHISPLFGPV